MSFGRTLVQRNAAWRVVVLLLMAGALAFAPIVRAACDIEHVVVLAGAGIDAHQAGAPGAPADHDGCCDDTSASISADVRPVSDDTASGSSTNLVLATAWQLQGVTDRPFSIHRTRFALVPPEPVFRRVRKLRL